MIAIIDYEAGNLKSVERAVKHLGFEAQITADPQAIAEAEKLIFPGVGAAGASMEVLHRTGLADVVKREILKKQKPFLAICIGIQILFEWSDEDQVECLGIFKGRVKKFPEKVGDVPLKIPQIGWNRVHQKKAHPIFEGVPDKAEFYFVNSYYCEPAISDVIIGETEYGIHFTSAVAKENIVATQFHLEKSGPVGLQMLKNFCQTSW